MTTTTTPEPVDPFREAVDRLFEEGPSPMEQTVEQFNQASTDWYHEQLTRTPYKPTTTHEN